MPECHNCPHNGRPTDACLACKGPPETNHKGKTWVSIDSGDDPQTAGMVEAVLAPVQIQRDDGVDLEDCCADAVRRMLAYLASISRTDLSLLMARTRGESLADWAQPNGVSRQGAHQRWTALCRRHPELRGIF